MYTFNRIDQRLQRLMEASIFIFESFAGFEYKYEHLATAKLAARTCKTSACSVMRQVCYFRLDIAITRALFLPPFQSSPKTVGELKQVCHGWTQR